MRQEQGRNIHLERKGVSILPNEEEHSKKWLNHLSRAVLLGLCLLLPNYLFTYLTCTKDFDCVDHNKMWKILKEMGIPDHLSGNGPHLAWRGEPPGFSRVAAGALDLRRGPQGPALVASGKASPHACCSGASRVPLPSMLGSKILCGVGART